MDKLKYKFFLPLTLLFLSIHVQSQTTSLSGTLTDKDTEEPIMFANVALYKNDVLNTGVESDLDGNYHFADIDSGMYRIETSFIGYETTKMDSVIIYSGQQNVVDIKMDEGDKSLHTGCSHPLIIENKENQNLGSDKSIDKKEERKLKKKNKKLAKQQ